MSHQSLSYITLTIKQKRKNRIRRKKSNNLRSQGDKIHHKKTRTKLHQHYHSEITCYIWFLKSCFLFFFEGMIP